MNRPTHRTLSPLVCGLACAGLTGLSAQGALIEDWQFNDASGTQLTALTNDGLDPSTFVGDAVNVTTDGGGNLAFTADASDVFRVSDSDRNISTGIVELNVLFTSASFDHGGNDSNVGVGLRDVGGNDNLFVIRIQERSNGDVRLQLRTSGNTTITDIAAVDFTNVAVRAEADLDADTVDIFWTINGGTEMSALGLAITDGDFDAARIQTNTSAWGTSETAELGYFTIDAVPEPGSLALLGMGTLLIARRRRG